MRYNSLKSRILGMLFTTAYLFGINMLWAEKPWYIILFFALLLGIASNLVDLVFPKKWFNVE